MANVTEAVPVANIEPAIRLIRGQKVMLDADLAALYGVETRTLVQAVQRNRERFPDDFMFRLSADEFADLRSQSVISSQWGGRRYPPYAFTKQGVAMLSSVLRSERAVQVNIEIMEPSCACDRCLPRTRSSRGGSTRWRSTTTPAWGRLRRDS